MSSDLEIEPTPGLPEDLPEGERILWRGRPSWKALARNTFRVYWLAAYFSVFATTRLALAVAHHEAMSAAPLVPIALALTCLGILCAVAWLHARATIYTVTSRRVVLRIGVAIPTTWNLPFSRLASADVVVRGEGDGDIVMQLKEPDRVGWLYLWPHTQPWHLARARPALRGIDDPRHVAELLSEAVREWAESSGSSALITSAESLAAVSQIPRSRPVITRELAEAGR